MYALYVYEKFISEVWGYCLYKGVLGVPLTTGLNSAWYALFVYEIFISKAQEFCLYKSVLEIPLTIGFNSEWYVSPVCIWNVH